MQLANTHHPLTVTMTMLLAGHGQYATHIKPAPFAIQGIARCSSGWRYQPLDSLRSAVLWRHTSYFNSLFGL